MGIRTLLYFYGRRLRTHPVQELLAGLGIAIGVALAFAVLVANSSVVASAREIVRGVSGSADLQLVARHHQGFQQSHLERVRRLPGVDQAAPLLERRAVLVSASGKEVAVNLVSVDGSLARLNGRLTRSFLPGGVRIALGGMMIPRRVAHDLAIRDPASGGPARPLPKVSIHLRGRAATATVAAVLGPDTLGDLTGAKIAVVPLPYLQQLAGLPNRISRILVDAEPGQELAVRRELAQIAEDKSTVADTELDVDLLKQATGPTDQVTGFFAATSALLGLLLAFNAMLLTVPERRRLVSSLRIQGYRPRQIVTLIMFQGTVLGGAASSAGLLVGCVLARNVFGAESPDYLAPGFTLGGRTIIGLTPILLAGLGGIVASCIASAPPLLDLRRGRAVDSVFHERGAAPGNALRPSAQRVMLAISVALFVAATLLLSFTPRVALLASAALALGTLFAIPTTFAIATRTLEWVINRVPRLSTLTIALLAMRATTLRSLALAATGAVAVFGAVAIGGARDDLLQGIGDYTSDYVGTADVWVVNPADNQATNDFFAGDLRDRIERLRGVRDVRSFQGSFLDTWNRRVWVIARPATDPEMVPPSSVVDGSLARADQQLRRGGWVAVSEQIARDQNVGVGGTIDVPTPSGRKQYRVAATTTNLGWAPGALILNSRDYRHAWQTDRPSAFEVDLAAGSLPAARQAIEQLVAIHAPGLRVQVASAREAQITASARQGLERLGQISLMLQIAAVLAMATALGAAIWQRRPALAALRIQSFKPHQLLSLLLVEAGVVLGAGGLTGALGGTYGRLGADRFLSIVTGFPVAPSVIGWHTVATLIGVVTAALALVIVPTWMASRTPARLGLDAD